MSNEKILSTIKTTRDIRKQIKGSFNSILNITENYIKNEFLLLNNAKEDISAESVTNKFYGIYLLKKF